MNRSDADRQMVWILLWLAEKEPGLVCCDTKCPTGDLVPHMANDGRDHPKPYGIKPISWPAAWHGRARRQLRYLQVRRRGEL